MIKFKKGFTYAEGLMVLAIMAIIAVVALPLLKGATPNSEHLMFRKAYYLFSNMVNELVNDEELYPDGDGDAVYLANTKEVEENGVTYSGETKFCQLVAARLNIVKDPVCEEKVFVDGEAPDGQFTTTDGMVWILPITEFNEEDYIEVLVTDPDDPDAEPEPVMQDNRPKAYIDTNGDKAPNCFYVKPEEEGQEASCKEPDRFAIIIKKDGRIRVEGDKEIEYLESENVTKSK